MVESSLNSTSTFSDDIFTEMSTLSTFNNITTTTFVKETLSITYANTTSTKTITTTRAPETYTIYYNITKNYHIKTTAAPICPVGQMINSNGGCSPIFVDLY